ncbi:MAG: hypothetical protein WC216_10210 [Gallionella sp.]|jgi:hypothetical protein
MKNLLSLAVALVALTVFPGVGVAQQKDEEIKPTTAPVLEQKAEMREITGKVTKVDPKTNTFTVKGEGVEVTLSARGELPKVGARIRIVVDCDFKTQECTIKIIWRKK